MNKMLKDTLILFAITLIAGLGLGFVYEVTKEPRKMQEAKIQMDAYQAVMPQMDGYQKVDHHISVMNSYKGEINEVVSATDKNGDEIGIIVTATDYEAYDGSLQMTVGILKDKTVKGISFLSLSETPGLGMKADEESFRNQFQDKKADYFVYTKNGAAAENEIDAISSATITTNAGTHGVNAALLCADYCQGGDLNE